MGLLRKRLEETSPELHAALERSWKIAAEEWLPAVNARSSSFNSYPHLRNIESHLDQVVGSLESLPDTQDNLRLRPVELYVLLASVLFHDLGRVHGEGGRKHALWSEHYLLRKYGNLGIPSPELAKCIATVSLGHDPPPSWRPVNLYDVVIDPHGAVRQRALAALLVLGDHMDSANTRAFPTYLQGSAEMGTVGLFRRFVRGVFADCESQMVRVVLSDMRPWTDDNEETSAGRFDTQYEFVAEKDLKEKDVGDRLRLAIEAARRSPMDDTLAQVADLGRDQWEEVRERLRQWFRSSTFEPAPSSGIWELLDDLPPGAKRIDKRLMEGAEKQERFRKMQLPDWLTAIGLLHGRPVPKSAVPKGGKEDGGMDEHDNAWPHPVLVAIMLRDTGANFAALETVRSDLAVIGVSLQSWLLEHREHLYNRYGWEVYEPIFDVHCLKRIAQAMWDLSLGVFGCSRFTYDELAAEAREPSVVRVRRAVRRLAILERCEVHTPRAPMNCCGDAIWAGESRWRWEKRRDFGKRCETCPVKECWRRKLRENANNGRDYLWTLIEETRSPTS